MKVDVSKNAQYQAIITAWRNVKNENEFITLVKHMDARKIVILQTNETKLEILFKTIIAAADRIKKPYTEQRKIKLRTYLNLDL